MLYFLFRPFYSISPDTRALTALSNGRNASKSGRERRRENEKKNKTETTKPNGCPV